MALKLTKNSKIIFAIVIVILSGALGYLIWRVNQPETVAPEESSADAYCPEGCYYIQCDHLDINPGDCAGDAITFCSAFQVGCYQYDSGAGCWKMCEVDPGDLPTDDCRYTYDCEYPTAAYLTDPATNTCTCYDWESTQQDPYCMTDPICSPDTDCADYGMEFCGLSGDAGAHDEGCVEMDSCLGYCGGCNNVSETKLYCKEAVVANVCDGGTWVTRPTGTVDFNSDITFSATATDSNGISGTSITANLCTGTVTTCTAGESIAVTLGTVTTTSTTFSGILSSSTDRLAAGTYTLSTSWADSLGATSASCALTTTFTVLEEETNPNWDIEKEAVELCIDEFTDNPKSQITYTITVTNTGDAAGNILKIEDVLDSKVLAGFIQPGITSPGVYSNGTIVWDYTASPLAIAAGASEIYTYKMIVDKDSFGTYVNTVTLTPEDSDTIQATANIPVDCELPEEPVIPQTGLFDTTIGRVIGGFVLVLLGALVYNLPNSVFRREANYKYRGRFEGRIIKKN